MVSEIRNLLEKNLLSIDKKAHMMWIFEKAVAEKRKDYDFLVKLLHVDGFAGARRRNGKIVRTQEPEEYPLSECYLQPSSSSSRTIMEIRAGNECPYAIL